MVKKGCIAIIPARGGSKRIKDKNIVDFGGMPMLARTIIAAQESTIFDRIVVSTDDNNIAFVAESYGVEVPFLRSGKNDDYSPVSEATICALNQVENYYGEDYGYVVQLMANCPLRNANDIRASFEHFLKSDSDFQISCFKFGWMNPWWAVRLDKDGTPERLFEKECQMRSQDLENLYCPTGAIWIAKTDKLKKAGTFYGEGYKMYPLNWTSAVDIDNIEDLEMAKFLARLKQEY